MTDVSATGLARSRDLDSWEWLGVVFAPSRPALGFYCRRINSIVSEGKYIAFYDGSAIISRTMKRKPVWQCRATFDRGKTLTGWVDQRSRARTQRVPFGISMPSTADEGIWAFFTNARARTARTI